MRSFKVEVSVNIGEGIAIISGMTVQNGILVVGNRLSPRNICLFADGKEAVNVFFCQFRVVPSVDVFPRNIL